MMREVAATFVELTRTLGEHVDEAEIARLVVRRSVDVLPVSAAAISFADGSPGPRAVSASHRAAGLAALLATTEDGPGRHCCHERAALLNVDLAAHAHDWPRFVSPALRLRVTRATALPVRTAGYFVGALVLVGDGGGWLDENQLDLARALAEAAAGAIVTQRELRRREIMTDQLRDALTSRVVIEQAKGVLAERWQVSVDEAFRLLRRHARSRNQKLAELARAVVEGAVEALPLHRDIPPDEGGRSR